MLGYYYDPTWLLLIPAIIMTLWAQAKVNATYRKYARVQARAGAPAYQMARQMLAMNGLNHVRVEQVAGNLTDHYDPRTKTLKLSQDIYGSSSVAALGIAAHECGHAIQDQEGYAPLKIRGALVPVANFSSGLSWVLILIGIILGFYNLIGLGIILFAAVVLFQLVTLPVEFNASRRALATLEGAGFLAADEVPQARKVLSAAALTYVAAALTAVLQLLRLVLLFGRRD